MRNVSTAENTSNEEFKQIPQILISGLLPLITFEFSLFWHITIFLYYTCCVNIEHLTNINCPVASIKLINVVII